MKLKKIILSFNDNKTIDCMVFCDNNYLDSRVECVEQDKLQSSAKMYLNEQKTVLIKLFNAQKGNNKLTLTKQIQNSFQKLTWTSTAVREFKGNAMLLKAGIHVPRRIGVGYPKGFQGKYRAVYIQEYIAGSRTCNEFFLSNSDLKKREQILLLIAQDIDKLLKAKIYYRDLNSKNIIVVNEKKIVWVDTIVRKYKIKKTLEKKIRIKVHTFIDRLVLFSNVSDTERQFFLKHFM